MKREITDLLRSGYSKMAIKTQSLSQIQKNIVNSTKQPLPLRDQLTKSTNITQFKVISPFYDRNKVCPLKNCHCPYHKRMRQQALRIKYRFKNIQNTTSAISSPNNNTQRLDSKGYRLTHKPIIDHQKENQTQESLKKSNLAVGTDKEARDRQLKEFMRLHQQLCQRKQDHHGIKLSVGQIFNYLYQHLDDSKQQIEQFINSIEKDRNISNFYIQRFQDMKQRRKMQRTKTKLSSILSQISKSSKLHQNDQLQGMLGLNRNSSRVNSKLFESLRPTNNKLTLLKNKMHKAKLAIQDLLQNLQGVEDINNGQIEDFTDLKLDLFQENYSYLKEKINQMNVQTLRDLKQKILLKIIKQLTSKDSNNIRDKRNSTKNKNNLELTSKFSKTGQNRGGFEDRVTSKTSTKFIKGQLQQFYKLQDSIGRNKHKSRVDSICLDAKQKMIEELLELVDIKLNQLEQSKLQSQQYKDKVNDISSTIKISVKPEDEETSSKQKHNSFRQSKKSSLSLLNDHNIANREEQNEEAEDKKSPCQTMFFDLQKNTPSQVDRVNRSSTGFKPMRLGKYRKLSHQGFFRRSFLDSNKNYDLLVSKLHYEDSDSINSHRTELQTDLTAEWKKLKEIELRISVYNLKEMIVQNKDSLLTVKRKARIFKKLLQQQVFQQEIQEQIKQYVGLIEQLNLVKNRRWASYRLRNMMVIEDNQIALIAERQGQVPEINIQQIVKDIASPTSWLLFYDITKTQLLSRQVFLKNPIFGLHGRDNQTQKRTRKRESFQYEAVEAQQTKKKTEYVQRQQDLIQIGLKNNCESNFLFDQSINHRQSYKYSVSELECKSKKVSMLQSKYIHNLKKQYSDTFRGYQYYC